MKSTDIVKEIMKKRKMTKTTLANELKVPFQTVYDRLNQTNISIDKLQEMLSVLGYTIAIVPDTYSFADYDAYIVTSSKNISPVIAEEISVVSQEPTAPTNVK